MSFLLRIPSELRTEESAPYHLRLEISPLEVSRQKPAQPAATLWRQGLVLWEAFPSGRPHPGALGRKKPVSFSWGIPCSSSSVRMKCIFHVTFFKVILGIDHNTLSGVEPQCLGGGRK